MSFLQKSSFLWSLKKKKKINKCILTKVENASEMWPLPKYFGYIPPMQGAQWGTEKAKERETDRERKRERGKEEMLLYKWKKNKIWLEGFKGLDYILNIRFLLHCYSAFSFFLSLSYINCSSLHEVLFHIVYKISSRKILSTQICKMACFIFHSNKSSIWDSNIWKSDQSNI